MNQIIILATNTDKWAPLRGLGLVFMPFLLILTVLIWTTLEMDGKALDRYKNLKRNLKKQIREHHELRERNEEILGLMDDRNYAHPFYIDELEAILEKYKDVKPEDDIFK